MSSYRSKRRRIQNEVNLQLASISTNSQNFVNQTGNFDRLVIETNEESGHMPNGNLALESSCINLDTQLLSNGLDAENVESIVSGNHDENLKSLALKEKIANWAVNYNISHIALTDLLKILQPHVVDDLPMSSKTLLKTPRKLNVTQITGGKYYYFGLSDQLKIILIQHRIDGFKFPKHDGETVNFISLSLSTDGIPICKSSNISMWPILVRIDQLKYFGPILVALYCGETKPMSISDFLSPFVTELKLLLTHGIYINSMKLVVKISSIIADAPARSFVKCVKGHTAYHGCERCDDEGDYFENRVVYSPTCAQERSNISFRCKQDEFHHQYNLESPFLDLEVDMIHDFVLDYMHLVCLGVTRKLLFLWLSGPLKTRLPARLSRKISDFLQNCVSSIPSEFSRKPRSLKDIHRFKATEYRQFLLYTGPSALLGVLDSKLYVHFLYLHCAMKILLSDKASVPNFNSLAKYLLEKFVKIGQEYYGQEFVVYNVHNLLHIADDGIRYGNLDNISAFPFENYMQKLKRYVRGQRMQLEQVINRVYEENQCSGRVKVSNANDQFKAFIKKRKVVCKNFVITCKTGNNCFMDQLGRILILDNIMFTNGKLNCTLMRQEEVSAYPIPSKHVDVYKVEATNIKVVIELPEILNKCMLIRYSSNYYLCHKLNLS